ncbi:hypothetical protein MKEN_01430800 [Mycena kentingensis (nom. inval.)]|nr:hypothetical protein MKEN_01430800 [Mycena kentingensis (nom. inval.)]
MDSDDDNRSDTSNTSTEIDDSEKSPLIPLKASEEGLRQRRNSPEHEQTASRLFGRGTIILRPNLLPVFTTRRPCSVNAANDKPYPIIGSIAERCTTAALKDLMAAMEPAASSDGSESLADRWRDKYPELCTLDYCSEDTVPAHLEGYHSIWTSILNRYISSWSNYLFAIGVLFSWTGGFFTIAVTSKLLYAFMFVSSWPLYACLFIFSCWLDHMKYAMERPLHYLIHYQVYNDRHPKTSIPLSLLLALPHIHFIWTAALIFITLIVNGAFLRSFVEYPDDVVGTDGEVVLTGATQIGMLVLNIVVCIFEVSLCVWMRATLVGVAEAEDDCVRKKVLRTGNAALPQPQPPPGLPMQSTTRPGATAIPPASSEDEDSNGVELSTV